MSNDFNLKEVRNNLVAKDNRLIQNSRFSLSTIENKAILYLISKIQPDDEPGKLYTFNCKEFQSLLKWTTTSYEYIKIMLQNLSDISWWIDGEIEGRKKDILLRWFDIVRMDPGNGNIEISFQSDMFPFLLDLQKHLEEDGRYYTTYKLQNVTLMKHRYSPRIYELLKSYQYNNKKWTFENGTGSEYDLQRRIADAVMDKKTRNGVSIIPESWSNWAVFKRDVLDPAVEEINKYTDIKVAYAGKKEDLKHRRTRAVRTIEFYMVGKTEPEQRETDDMIDAEYTVIEDYHQMSIEELFFSNHDKKLEEEEDEKRREAARKMEEEIESSNYPMVYEILNDTEDTFSNEQITAIFEAVMTGRLNVPVPLNERERIVVDVAMYYYDKIKATKEETKTTIYKRLLDAVSKDYDQIIPGLMD